MPTKKELEDQIKKLGEQHKKLRNSHQKILSETIPSTVDRKRKAEKQIEALNKDIAQFDTVVKNLRAQAEKDDKAADDIEKQIMKLQDEIKKLR